MPKFLVIQTAFIGDAVLATALIEKLRRHFPQDPIDLVVRRGNEPLFTAHPHLRKVYVWDKRRRKYGNLFSIAMAARRSSHDYVINLQRFLPTGLLCLFCGARRRIGFSNNPLSLLYHFKQPYPLDGGLHEVQRNQRLIAHLTDAGPLQPVLYPSATDLEKTAPLKAQPYICLAPGSVWFTKKMPAEKWIQLARQLIKAYKLYFMGAEADRDMCDRIIAELASGAARNLCGELSLLQSAALMQDARMNYVNDSAPLHLASAVNAPTTAFFCSTVTDFGFGPLADTSIVGQIQEALYCRPCGVHGRKSCPEGHFRCGHAIEVLNYLPPPS